MNPAPLDRVEARLGEVVTRLAAATGGQALCRLDGHPSSAKELEGRMAVLLELRRALRRDPDADPAGIVQRWREDLEARRARGASQAWLAYLAGGVAEVEALTGAAVLRPPGNADRRPGVFDRYPGGYVILE